MGSWYISGSNAISLYPNAELIGSLYSFQGVIDLFWTLDLTLPFVSCGLLSFATMMNGEIQQQAAAYVYSKSNVSNLDQWLVILNFMKLLLICQRYRIARTKTYIRHVPFQDTTDMPHQSHKVV